MDYEAQRKLIYEQVAHLFPSEETFWLIARSRLEIKRELFGEASFWQEVKLNDTVGQKNYTIETNSSKSNKDDEIKVMYVNLPMNGEMGDLYQSIRTHTASAVVDKQLDYKADI